MVVFLLIDSRIPPQQIDLDFIQKLATMGLPFVLTFTKTDKISNNLVNQDDFELPQNPVGRMGDVASNVYHLRREKNRPGSS